MYESRNKCLQAKAPLLVAIIPLYFIIPGGSSQNFLGQYLIKLFCSVAKEQKS